MLARTLAAGAGLWASLMVVRAETSRRAWWEARS
jgi:hypothetical protein